MKIAIASSGEQEDSLVSPVSGRAEYYLIYENDKLVKTIKNPFVVGGGAGYAVAGMLINEKVDVVVAGNVGANMKIALEEKNVTVINISEKSVKEALIEVLNAKAKKI